MPWKRTGAVDERLRFIATVQSSDDSFSEICRRFGVSRRVGYKWLKRYQLDGPSGLDDRAPLALTIKHKLPPSVVARIIQVRKEHPTWGPRKIRKTLEAHCFWRVPATSTIGDVLTNYGLITKRRARRATPPSASPMAPTTKPNETWCVDFKGHFAMKNGVRCHPLTLTDHETRYLLLCEGLEKTGEDSVRPHFDRAFRDYGLPERIRSDNGPPFATSALGGLSKLSVWWIKLGITPERIAPGKPQQNGRHERMHRTLAEEIEPQADIFAQQIALDRFRHVFNELRPHEALDMSTPSKIYRPPNRKLPLRSLDPEYPTSMEVRRLDRDGRMRFGGAERTVVSRVLAGEAIGLEPIDDDVWRIHFGSLALADLTLTRRAGGSTPIADIVPI